MRLLPPPNHFLLGNEGINLGIPSKEAKTGMLFFGVIPFLIPCLSHQQANKQLEWADLVPWVSLRLGAEVWVKFLEFLQWVLTKGLWMAPLGCPRTDVTHMSFGASYLSVRPPARNRSKTRGPGLVSAWAIRNPK